VLYEERMHWVIYIVTSLIVAYFGAVLNVLVREHHQYWLLIVLPALALYFAWLMDRFEHQRLADERLREEFWSEPLSPESQPPLDAEFVDIGEGPAQSDRAPYPGQRAYAQHRAQWQRVLN
jgi:hypothetical protein